MAILIISDKKRTPNPYEYFCKRCRQLRLSFIESDECANCGSKCIIKGEINTLDKQKLIEENKTEYDENENAAGNS